MACGGFDSRRRALVSVTTWRKDMPTLENRRRIAEVRQYFRDTWAGRAEPTLKDAREDIMHRFSFVDQAYWNRLRLELKKANKEAAKRPENWQTNDTPPAEPPPTNGEFTLDIPGDLDTSAKLAFSRLVDVLISQRIRLHELDYVSAKAAHETVLADKKIRFLKKLVGDLSDAL
jgi:hypothetical protein